MQEKVTEDNNAISVVAALTDHELDKYSMLEKVIEQAGFFEILEKAWKESGKEKRDFKVVIKPNLSMMLRRGDVGTYTDPFLVIHLLRLLLRNGYSNLAVVESQNLYGSWFGNRSVLQVGARAGYFDESVIESYRGEKEHYIRVVGGGVDARVPLVDLTLDMTPYEFGDPIGRVELGRTWIEADFRINFAKIKSHFYSYYSLAIKNIYGCLPKQDKVRSYHCKKAVGPWTAHMIKRFPVHFSILDGYTAADGWFGVKMKAIANKIHTIIAGADIMAVDHYGASLIGLNPRKSILYSSLKKLAPLKPYKVVGNAEPFRKWRNPPLLLVRISMLLDSYANIMDFAGSIATGGHDECFPVTLYEGRLLRKIVHYLTIPINVILDAGLIKLRLNEILFDIKLGKHRQSLPTITNSSFVSTRLKFLGKMEIEKLVVLLERNNKSRLIRSGHYMVSADGEVMLPAPMSASNIAIGEILDHVRENNLDEKTMAGELAEMTLLCPGLFNADRRYPYCYS